MHKGLASLLKASWRTADSVHRVAQNGEYEMFSTRRDYNLKNILFERLLLILNQFHLLGYYPLPVSSFSSNCFPVFFLGQNLTQCSNTTYYLC